VSVAAIAWCISNFVVRNVLSLSFLVFTIDFLFAFAVIVQGVSIALRNGCMCLFLRKFSLVWACPITLSSSSVNVLIIGVQN